MELVGWVWWLVSALATGSVTLIWFLISGWVSTLLQIALLVVVIYLLKYKIWRRSRSFGSFFVNWIPARDLGVTHQRSPQAVRVITVKEFGDINISTLLSLLTLVGLVLAARI